ncbi:helix-turn-helix domain-containing protein [Allostreptomyces psammosilenae]|uniref:Transcriptional regulator with XRE-family HTH domain n=1 Tax=Allostreptomyces psammosilenae TaxID=1892865 RepID=A0A852ZTS1_9ACTN|nr:helix-turn-helix transcriptional regulator [Allostreptomyces psammosilenae]NYI05803.1 transcriptional regulator with XRE-family HTH domain [Allostreptomyces psammosilenae]
MMESHAKDESVLALFGSEMRLERTRAKMSQSELAAKCFCTQSLLSKIEATKRLPSEDLAKRLDEIFKTGGRFERMWPTVVRHAYPVWFRPYVELEAAATHIQTFEAQIVPGLLQTEDYARAVFGTERGRNTGILLDARMARQRILDRDEPPLLWFIMDETALRRNIGGAEVMRAQMERMLHVIEQTPTVIQVVPFDVGVRPGLSGSFATLSFDDGPDVLYEESFYEGQLRGEKEPVGTARDAYDLLRAVALSPGASADLIASIAKDTSWVYRLT